MANEKLTLYILVGMRSIACDWRPLRAQPNKDKYRPYKKLSHPDVTFQLAKLPNGKLTASRINYAVMIALQAAELSPGKLSTS